MRTITVEEFKEGAPERYEDIFCKEFPDGLELTRESIIRAHNAGIDTAWLCNIVLSSSELRDYDNTFDYLWYVDYEHIQQDIRNIQQHVSDRLRQHGLGSSWELIQSEEAAISSVRKHFKRALVDIHIMYLLREQNDSTSLP